MDEIMLQKNMTNSERMIFIAEMNKERKNASTAILLALFLGGLGAHQFYMGKVGIGILYVLFCWTFIPSIIAFIELFFLTARVRKYNMQKAQEIAAKVKMIA
jgi:TM2 domain-containing membrane protein YozV